MSTPDAEAGPRVGVLGPVAAWDGDGRELALGGARQRELLARLVAARGRTVGRDTLIRDLWPDDPPDSAVATVRTFVRDLRRALEPERAPRANARTLRTVDSGYRLDLPGAAVDAWLAAELVRTARDQPLLRQQELLVRGLALWRGQPLAGIADHPWSRAEADRLDGLRVSAVEGLAGVRIRLGTAEGSIEDLRELIRQRPERQTGWPLLAQALFQAGRHTEALDVLREARARLRELGLDPTPELESLHREFLRGTGPATGIDGVGRDLWGHTVAAYTENHPTGRVRITSSADLLRSIALTNAGGLVLGQARRLDVLREVEATGDTALTAQVLARMDIPGLWSCLDDPDTSAQICLRARRCLAGLNGDTSPALRARLLGLIGVERRGADDPGARRAALEAEEIARRIGDPRALAIALNARFLQSFGEPGGWPARAGFGDELVVLSERHDLDDYAVLGHLIGMQAAAARRDVATADEHAASADRLGQRHERSLVAVFTTWYAALRTVLTGAGRAAVSAAYDSALVTLDGCGMPGVATGLPALARACLALRHREPVTTRQVEEAGPHAAYLAPLATLAQNGARAAVPLLHAVPDPPADHFTELRWALLAVAARRTGDRRTARRVLAALDPVITEDAGAGTGMLSLGTVAEMLALLRELG